MLDTHSRTKVPTSESLKQIQAKKLTHQISGIKTELNKLLGNPLKNSNEIKTKNYQIDILSQQLATANQA